MIRNMFKGAFFNPNVHPNTMDVTENRMARTPISVVLKDFEIKLLSRKDVQSDGLFGSPTSNLVQRINATIQGGTMFGILGGSGSGKTTLLNAIANRVDRNVIQVIGDITFRGGNGSFGVGFVSQHDYLLPYLTVHETLTFAARLVNRSNDLDGRKLNNGTSSKVESDISSVSTTSGLSDEAALQRTVRQVILDLGLKEVADSYIGQDGVSIAGRRGLSGGEKRRVSAGIQILSDPLVLCADEPTSGLDSFTASTVVESLQRLAAGPRRTTVICSIHQPRADIFHQFDSVLILSRGFPTYIGKTADIVSYFASIDAAFDCPAESNPADFYVDLCSLDMHSQRSENESRERIKLLVAAVNDHAPKVQQQTDDIEDSANNAVSRSSIHERLDATREIRYAPWFVQVRTLLSRFILNNFRNPFYFVGSLFQALEGLVIMVLFWNLSDSLQTGIQSRVSLMYLSITAEYYILLIVLMERYCSEIQIFDREQQDSMYSPTAYLFAHFISSIPQLVLQPIAFSLPIYYGCNLRHGLAHMALYLIVNIIVAFVINGIAWFSVTIHREFSVASLIGNTSFTFLALTSGYLVNLDDLPVYISWLHYISYCGYGFKALMINEFTDRVFPGCPYPNPSDCTQWDGNSINAGRAVSSDELTSSVFMLLVLVIGYHIFAGVLLNVYKVPPAGMVADVGGAGNSVDDDDKNNNALALARTESIRNAFTAKIGSAVTVEIKDISLFARPPVTIVSRLYDSCRQNNASAEYSRLSVSDPDDEFRGSLLSGEEVDEADEANKIKDIDPDVETGEGYRPPLPVSVSQQTIIDPVDKGQAFETAGTQKAKSILRNVSARIKPGRLVALMGGSGSGKTSLLNLIAGRITHTPITSPKAGRAEYVTSGSITYNKRIPTKTELRQMIGYVQQFDYHLPALTVRETLMFNSFIRLPIEWSVEVKADRAESVLEQLGLKLCANTLVGGEAIKGISGGEKRRLSLGIQLLSDPDLCLLDEPTTGLDAFTARQVVQTLRDLAMKGRTVILSIHQPRYDVFALLHDVLLLSRGSQVWWGDTASMLRHFEQQGQPCPMYTNPADFILDISSIDLRNSSSEVESTARWTMLVDAFTRTKATESETSTVGNNVTSSTADGDCDDSEISVSRSDLGLLYTLPLLLRRSLINQWRQPIVMSTRVSQGIFFALILCLFFAPIGNDQASVGNRIGVLYMSCSTVFLGMLNNIAIYPTERNVFYREYLDGGYSPFSFFSTYFILAFPFLLLTAASIACLLVYAIGLNGTFMGFLYLTFVIFSFTITGEFVGIAFCSLFFHIGFTVNIISVVLSIFSIMAGFLTISMPLTIVYINNISPLRWGSWLSANVVFENVVFTCTPEEQIMNGVCPTSTGEQVLSLYKFEGAGTRTGYAYHAYILGAIVGAIGVVSFSVLRWRASKLRR